MSGIWMILLLLVAVIVGSPVALVALVLALALLVLALAIVLAPFALVVWLIVFLVRKAKNKKANKD